MLFVSVDVGEMGDTLMAFNRLLDIRPEEGVDVEVMRCVVSVVEDLLKEKVRRRRGGVVGKGIDREEEYIVCVG